MQNEFEFLVNSYIRFGTPYFSHHQGTIRLLRLPNPLKLIRTSSTNQQTKLRNVPEYSRPISHCGGSLKSFSVRISFPTCLTTSFKTQNFWIKQLITGHWPEFFGTSKIFFLILYQLNFLYFTLIHLIFPQFNFLCGLPDICFACKVQLKCLQLSVK